MTEAELRRRIIVGAVSYGIGIRYVPDSRRELVGRGFPDLVLAGLRVEFWELKTETGVLEPDQMIWAGRLTMAEGVMHRTVRPSDLRCGLVAGWLRELSPLYAAKVRVLPSE